MRILFISNYFPPYFIGGYELRCKDVAEELKHRGHSVFVLTSRWGKNRKSPDSEVGRLLWLSNLKLSRLGILRQLVKEWLNQRALKQIIREFRPDRIFVWNLGNIGKSLLAAAQQSRVPVFYYIEDSWIYKEIKGDFWFSYSQEGLQRFKGFKHFFIQWIGRILPLGLQKIDPKTVMFVSQFMKKEALEADLPVEDSPVVYPGIPGKDFSPVEVKQNSAGKPRLLYVGQINQLKGIFTLLKAFDILVERGFHNLELSLVGGVDERDANRFRESLQKSSRQNRIKWMGQFPRDQMNSIYQSHDILVFPSERGEGVPLTLAEAMSCGMAIVSTSCGGSAEILRDGDNAFVFAAGNAVDCADKIQQLLTDHFLQEKLSKNAIAYTKEHFDLRSMGEAIEEVLLQKHSPAYTTLVREQLV